MREMATDTAALIASALHRFRFLFTGRSVSFSGQFRVCKSWGTYQMAGQTLCLVSHLLPWRRRYSLLKFQRNDTVSVTRNSLCQWRVRSFIVIWNDFLVQTTDYILSRIFAPSHQIQNQNLAYLHLRASTASHAFYRNNTHLKAFHWPPFQ